MQLVKITQVATNTAATGAPAISGVEEVGQALTAGTGTIADADGLTKADNGDAGFAYTYQWIRIDSGTESDITGATSSTYTLVAADEGNTIKVRVSFTDDAGNAESRTSEATGTIAADSTPPALESGTISGSTVTLVFNEDLDEGSTPSLNLFRLNAPSFSNVVVSGRTIILTWSGAAQYNDGETYRLTYVPLEGAGTPAQDKAGNRVAQILNFVLDNITPDTVAPSLAASDGAVVNGTSLVLTYDEALDEDSTPAASAFTVTVAGSAVNVTDVSVSGSAVTLTLSSAVSAGDTVTVSYTPGTSPIQDEAGNDAAALTNQAVVNNTQVANTPATGVPAISIPDSLEVGRTLTAGTGTIADADGLTKADNGDAGFAYTYQWIRVDNGTEANITGATSSTYTLVAADEDKTIKVRASFTDDAGNAESRTSAETDFVKPDQSRPEVSTLTVDGTTLVVTYDEALDESSTPPADSFTVTGTVTTSLGVSAVVVDGATVTLTLAVGAVHGEGVVLDYVTPTGAGATPIRDVSGNQAGDIQNQRVTNNTADTTAPVLAATDGATVNGATLTLTYDEALNEDSTPAAGAYTVTVAGSSVSVTDISVSGSAVTLTLASAVAAGQAVTVSYTVPGTDPIEDAHGNAAAALTNQTVTNNTPAANTPATGEPEISGSPRRFTLPLRASKGTIADTNGLTRADDGESGFAYTYQWIRVDNGTEADITGATSSTYRLAAADVGKTIKVRVSFTDDAGHAESRTSAATLPVITSNTPATGRPTFSGTFAVGQTVTVDTSAIMDATNGLTNPEFEYDWQRSGDLEYLLASTTMSQYTLVEADEGHRIYVTAYFEDDYGNQETRSSDASEVVAAALSPAVLITPVSLTVTEGSSASYEVELATEPTAAVTVTPSVAAGGDVDLTLASSSALTFTSADWDTAQTVTVNAAADADTDDGTATINHAVASTGDYSGVTAPSVTVTESDTTNTPATGAPAITGTETVGETLTAGIGSMADTDGLPSTFPDDYSLQWVRLDADGSSNPVDISGATSSTYTLVAADEGKTVRVRASFTDGSDNAESLTSEATGTIAAADTVAPSLSSATVDGVSLVLTYDEALDEGSTPAVGAFAVTAAGSTATVSDVDVSGSAVTLTLAAAVTPGDTVTVSYTPGTNPIQDEAGNDAAALSGQAVTNNTADTIAPVLSTATVNGATLVLTYDEALDEGSEPAVGAFAVTAGGSTVTVSSVDVSGSAVTLTLAAAVSAGDTVTLDYTPGTSPIQDEAGNDAASLTNQAVVNNTVANTPATGEPEISGIPRDGNRLDASKGTIADTNGLTRADNGESGFAYTYQWIRVDNGTEADISGATSSTYTLVAADEGKTIKVRVSFTDDAGHAESRTSAATLPVILNNTFATGKPTLSGTFAVGQTVTVDTSAIMDANGLTDPMFLFHWQRSDNGSFETFLASTTMSQYTLGAADEGHRIRVNADFTDDYGYDEHVDGEASEVVAAALSPAVLITPTSLTVTEGSSASYEVELATAPTAAVTVTPSVAAGGDVDLTLASSSALTFTSADWDTAQTVTVNAAVDADTDDGTATINHTVASTGDYSGVTAPSVTVTESDTTNTPATGAPAITGTETVGETLTAGIGSMADTDGLPSTFPDDYSLQWVRLDADGSSNPVDISGATSSTYTLVAADEGKTVRVRASFTDGSDNAESLTSEATGTIAAADTVAPSLSSATVDGVSLVLTYDEALDEGSTPAVGAFAVTAAGSTATVSDVDVSGSAVTLTLAAAVTPGDTVTVSYTPGTNPIQDEAGNDAAALSGQAVTNNTADTIAPVLSTATVNGATLVLTYDEALDEGSEPAVGAFAVTAGGSTVTVSSVDVSGSAVTLTLAAAVSAGDTVTLDYTPGTSPIQDEAGNDAASLTNQAVVNNTVANTPATGEPEISGIPRDGNRLDASKGTIADTNGLTRADNGESGFAYTYQWIRVDNGTEADISGATSSTYTLVAADEGKTIKVRVSFTDDAGHAESRTSAATLPVILNNTFATGKPTLSGTFAVGQTVTVDTSAIMDANGLTDPMFLFHWQRSDNGSFETFLASTTMSQYTLGAADEGHRIRVNADFTDDYGYDEHVDGEASEVVAAALSPAVLITPTSLTVTEGSSASYEVELATAPTAAVTVTPSVAAGGDVDLTLASSSALTFTSADWDTAQTVTVNAAVDADTDDGTATINHTVASTGDYSGVTAPSVTVTESDTTNTPATGAPAITGTETVGETLTAGIGSMADTDGLPSTFPDDYSLQWVRLDADGSSNPVDISGATSSTYTLVAADEGKTVRVRASFTDGSDNAESLTSEATGTIAAADTVAPSLSSATVDGASLVLTYDEALDESSEPAVGAFAVTVAGSTATVSSVDVSGSAVTLTLASAVSADDTVTLDYTPGAHPIQDEAGNDAAALAGQAVTNNTADTTAPVLSTATVDGVSLVLTYDEALDEGSTPAAGAFAVTAGGSTVTVLSVDVSGSAVTLTLASAVGAGDTVTLDYTPGADPIQDEAGNDAAALAGQAVVNNTADTTAPVLSTATVDGASLVLTYDEALDEGSEPAVGAFAVTAGGSTVTVSSVDVSGSAVTLTLASAVSPGDTVTLDYTPGADPIQDEAGNDAAALSGQAVTNNTADTIAPVLSTATVDGATLVLTYDEALDEGSEPAVGAFAVTAGGSTVTVSSVDVSGSAVTLTLASAVSPGDTVTLDYTPGADPIQDEAGNDAAALSGQAVVNNTADTTAPVLSTATVDGATLVLTYDEALDEGSEPAAGDLAVTAGGSTVTVSSVDVSGSAVTLTLASAVAARQTVTVSYTPGTSPIQDEAGNDAAALTGQAVVNNTADTIAPVLSTATVDGATLVLTYDEALDEGSEPAAGAFAVTAGGSTVTVSSVDVSGSAVTLTLASAVGAGDTVTLDYTPGADPIQDEAGNDAAALAGQAVTNNTADTTAPVLSTATVDGATLVLTYDEALDEGSEPAVGAFAVTAAGSTATVSDVDVSGSAVTLTLAAAVTPGDTVTVSYTPGTNPIQDEAGNDAAALSGQAVTNNTADTIAPVLSTATVNGATLVLTYDEALDEGSEPDVAQFNVQDQDAFSFAVTDVTVSGTTVTLTLAAAVAHGDTVTMFYTVPTTNPIQDEAGNDVAALTNQAVVNNTADTTVPVLSTATVDGATLVLTYDEALDEGSEPAAGDLAVTAGGSTVTVSSVDVSGSAVTLTLASAVAARQTVTVSYTPGTSPIQDEAGNDAAALTGQAVVNNTADTIAPVLSTATVDGATLVLTYDEALDEGSEPAAGAFAVTAGGSTVTVSSVDVSGSAVTLTLASAVGAGDTVTLDYTPGADPIQDEAGNDAAALAGQAVTNNTADTTAPVLSTATVDGATLVLTYDEALDEGSEPAVGAFAVTAAGSTATVSDVDVSGSAVTLTLAAAVTPGDTVTVSYTPGTNPIQDEAGNDAAALSGQAVTNNTADTIAPVLSTATVNGATLVLTYDEALDEGSEPAAGSFAVTAGGSTVTVSDVDVSGSAVTLTLAAAVSAGDTVTLDYTPGTSPIQDEAGNDAAALTNQAVVNNTADTTVPLLSTAAVDGATLVLTYDEALDEGSTPAAGAFAVTAGGSTVTVSSVDVSGSAVTLTLASAVSPGDTVTVSYTPGTSPIQDEAGNDAAALSGQAVVNNTADTAVPLLSTAAVDGATLVLTYDEALDEGSTPAAGAFAVTVAGSTATVSDVDVSGSAVTLTLASAVAARQTVTVSYTVPGTSPIQDEAGNDAAALTGQVVVNNTADTIAPALDSATVSGASLLLTYDEALDESSEPAAGAFAVTVAGSTVTVSSVDVSGSAVTLTLASAVSPGDAVTLDYTPGADPIQDEAGNDAAALSGRPVVNNSEDSTAPVLQTATVNGATLVLTYDEALDTRSAPAANAYSVSLDTGAGAAPANVDVSGSAVTLTLASAVSPGDTVTVSYTVPVTDPVQDLAGNDAAALTGQAVVNITADTTVPVLSTATVDGASLVLTYDEALDEGSTPAPGAFAVTAAGSAVTVSSVDVRGSAVTLTLASAVAARQTVTVSYTVPGTSPIQDEAGNDAAALAGQAVVNNTADTIAPALDSATVSGASLLLTYDEALDEGSEPAASAFAVTAAGSAVTVSSVDVSGSAVRLTLASAVSPGDTVTVSYTVPVTDPIQDEAGNDAAALTGRAVVNNTADTLAPSLDSATVSGATLVLKYDEALDEGSTPAPGAFAVTAAGSAVTVSSVDVRGSAVTLTLASEVAAGQTVTVSYAPGTNPIQDEAGNEAAALTGRAVTNNTADTIAPTLSTATVDGASLVLTYDEALDESSEPAAGAFAVTAGGSAVTVSSVAVSGSAVTLTLASEVAAGQTVTVSYTPGTSPIQDEAGNDAVALTNQAVTNNTADTIAPTLSTATVDGASLVLTYDEALDEGLEPAAGAFAVTAGGSTVTVSSVDVSGSAVTLTLASAVSAGDTVTVSYTPGTSPIQDEAGNEAAALTGQGVVNNTADTTVPVLSRATVSGATLVLTYDEALNEDLTPAANAYAVVVNAGAGAAPASVAVSGSVVTLTLAAAVSPGDTVTVSYRVPATSPIQDLAGNGAAALSRQAVVNNTADTTVPVLSTATVDGASLVLTYDEALDESSEPASAAFAVTAAGSTVTVSSVAMSGSTVTLTLASAVSAGDTVTVSYTPGASPIQDEAGNGAAALTGHAVTNATNAPATGAPAITGAEEVGQTLTAGKGTIADADGLTKADNGDAGFAYTYQWIRVDNGTEADITGATSSTYTLAAADEGNTIKVKVSFTDDAGNGESRTSEATGTIAAADTTAPSLAASGGAVVDGTTLTLTYDEALNEGSTPAASAFAVTAGGSTVTVSDVNVSGSTVTLTLASAVSAGDTVTVNYTPGADPIQDEAGNDAAALTGQAVVNNTADTTEPMLEAASADGDMLTLTFSEELDTASEPGTDAFTVKVNGAEVSVISLSLRGRMITLRLARPVQHGDRVTIAYVASGANPISDGNDNHAGSFDDLTVTNESPGLAFSTDRLDLDEGASETYTVALTARPDSDVMVALVSDDPEAVSVSPVSLTFTMNNFSMAQTVTVNAVPDADTEDERDVALTHTASGGGYGDVTGTVTVNVNDDDEPNRPATGAPAILGTAEVGQTLTVDLTGISDPDGLTGASYAYQWIRVDPAGAESEISGATGSSYDMVEADAGNALKVRVRFTDDLGNAESLVSSATTLIAKPNRAPEAIDDDAQTDADTAVTVDVLANDSDPEGDALTITAATVPANGTATIVPGGVSYQPDPGFSGEDRFEYTVSDGSLTDTAVVRISVAESKLPDLAEGWLSRFGRTASMNTMEAVSQRLDWPVAQESQVSLNGWQPGREQGWKGLLGPLNNYLAVHPGDEAAREGSGDENGADVRPGFIWGGAGAPGGMREGFGRFANGRNPVPARPSLDPAAALHPSPQPGWAVPRIRLRDLLVNSSFRFSGLNQAQGADDPASGRWTVWGQGAAAGFQGSDEAASYDAEVFTGMIGADYQRERILAGFAVSYSDGSGDYGGQSEFRGELDSTLTAVHPYLQWAVNDRMAVWGMLGFGRGEMRLGEDARRSAVETDIGVTMGGLGLRGTLNTLDSGIELAIKSDLFVTRVSADKAERLQEVDADASRLRLVLDASDVWELAADRSLRLSIESGLRYDDGDADTGGGLEVAGGLRYSDPARSLVMELNARKLVAHEQSSYEEWGAQFMLALQPDPSGLGPSLTLGSTWGVAQSRVQGLWMRHDTRGIAPGAALDAGQRFQAQFEYGLNGFQGNGLWVPYLGIETAGVYSTMRLGVNLVRGTFLTAGIEIGRQEGGGEAAQLGAVLNASLRW